MISAQRINWCGLDSMEFDLITYLSFDSDNGNVQSFLNQDGIYTEHYDGHRTIHRAKTNEFFTPTFTFLKDGFGDFTMEEQRKILSWLSTDKPGWLNVYHDDSNVLSYRCFGTWESIELYKLGNGRVVGYVVSFASTHPYAWSDKFSYPSNYNETDDYLQVNGVEQITITCNTDEYNKLIYPKVIVDFNGTDIYFPISKKPSSDDYMIPNVIYTFIENDTEKFYVSISTADELMRAYVLPISGNTSANEDLLSDNPDNCFYDKTNHIIKKLLVDDDGKLIKDIQGNPMWKTIVKAGAAVKINTSYKFGGETVTKDIVLKGAALGEKITLDGTNKIISVVPDDYVRIIGDDFNWEWLPLAYEDNNITISGNCAVQIQWMEPRKVGSL